MWKLLVLPLVGDISELGFANVFDLISTLLSSVLHVLWKYSYSATYLVANDMVYFGTSLMLLLLVCPQSTTAMSQALSVPQLGRRVAAAVAGLRSLKQQINAANVSK